MPGDLQSTMATVDAATDQLVSTPLQLGSMINGTESRTSLSAATLSSTTLPGSIPAVGRAKGLQLGASRQSSSRSKTDSFVAELAGEAESEAANAWEDGDLMDVNADEGDWSAFVTAPADSQVSSSSGPRSGVVVSKPKASPGLGFGEVATFSPPTLSVDGRLGTSSFRRL